jgi:hypothetical protein
MLGSAIILFGLLSNGVSLKAAITNGLFLCLESMRPLPDLP